MVLLCATVYVQVIDETENVFSNPLVKHHQTHFQSPRGTTRSGHKKKKNETKEKYNQFVCYQLDCCGQRLFLSSAQTVLVFIRPFGCALPHTQPLTLSDDLCVCVCVSSLSRARSHECRASRFRSFDVSMSFDVHTHTHRHTCLPAFECVHTTRRHKSQTRIITAIISSHHNRFEPVQRAKQ